MNQSKPCKGNYRANYFKGCGTTDYSKRTYGLCPKCLYKWKENTQEGKQWFKKQLAFKIKKNKLENAKKEKKISKQMKIDSMSTSTYWSKVFQPRINQIVKIIDKGNGCIVTNSTLGKQNAGHYYSVGSNKTLSLHLANIHLQSEQSNSFRGGQPIEYLEGLKRVYGENYANYVVGLKKCPALNVTKIELLEIYPLVLDIRRNLLKQNLFKLSPQERIELRNQVNEQLNLYPKEYAIYLQDKIY